MKKIIFLMSILCLVCSCGTQDKKNACQIMCDSLSAAQTVSFKVISVEETSWVEKKSTMMMSGKVPVPLQRTYEVKGSILTVSSNQQIRTYYVNVPVGATVVQKPIYVPKKHKGCYSPELKRYEHTIVSDGKSYPLNL